MGRGVRRRTRVLAVLVLALALGTAGCATSTGAAGDGPGDPVSTTNPALDFVATDLEGAPITGVDGPTVLWFWAPWCPICRGEAPVIAGAVTDNPEVTFLGVAGRDELAAIEEFPAETGTDNFRHVPDLDGTIWASFGVTSQPAMALITPDGTVKVITGAMSPQDVQDKIDTYLG